MPDHRPLYHFRPAANWINDPNGPIQWKGRYHLFYQYNPDGPAHGVIHWGHAVSADMVRWSELPLALSPTPGGPDEAGCWSGCAVDNDGVPTVIYTGVRKDDDHGLAQTQCLATGSDDLLTWRKHPENPVIAAPPTDLDLTAFRDPYVWKEGATWYCVIGVGVRGSGGAVLLYASRDLQHWDYLKVLYGRAANDREQLWTGSVWECPQFFPLDGMHVLIVSVWDKAKLNYPAYFVGTYANQAYAPSIPRKLDLGPEYYAPATFLDDAGRRIIWGWLWEARSAAAQRAAGWAGVMSLPRVLTLRPDNTLGIEPVAELQQLRGAHDHCTNLTIDSDTWHMLPGIQGDSLEIVVEFDLAASDAVECGLLLRCSPGREEYTRIAYERASRRVVVDREHASLDPDSWRGAHGDFCPEISDGRLRQHIFLDRSVVEVFIDGRSCLTARIYPTRPDSLAVGLFAVQGCVRVSEIDIWRLTPSAVRGPAQDAD